MGRKVLQKETAHSDHSPLVMPLEQVFHPNRIETDIVFIFTGKQMFVLLPQHFSHHKGGSSQRHFPVQAALLSSGKTQVSSKSSKAFPCI